MTSFQNCGSLVCTWEFVRSYLVNVAWEGLGDIAVLGALVRALRTTIDEMDHDMSTLRQGMNKELTDKLSAKFPVLTYQPLALPPPPPEPPEESDRGADSTEGGQ